MTNSNRCQLCGDPIDPLSPYVWRRVVGWERKAMSESRKSGSDIRLREPRNEYAHDHCIELNKAGVNVRQQTIGVGAG